MKYNFEVLIFVESFDKGVNDKCGLRNYGVYVYGIFFKSKVKGKLVKSVYICMYIFFL